MKLRKIASYLTLAVIAACLCLSGCGSSSSATTVSVTINSSLGTTTLILGQSTTLTAVVLGTTTLTVTWQPCMFTTTPTTGTNPKPTTPAPCPSDGSLGTLSNEQSTGTATFTAPQTLPDQTKYPNLAIIITATSVANTSKSGNISLHIDSGISVSITPSTAAVPTNEKQPFFAVLANDLQSKGVTWLLTQSTPTTSTLPVANPYMSLATCTVTGNATGCGSIDANGVYTAPAVVPTASVPANASTTPASVTLVATSVEDNTRFTLGTITITAGGPITFNGISPTIAPQGAEYWDIYLNAPNITSASLIHLSNSPTPLNSATGQVKVLFPIPSGTVTSPPSTGARIRLLASNLAGTGPVTVSVTDPGQTVTTTPGGTFTYNIMPVRPTSVFSSPSDVIQGSVSSGNIGFSIDGGYFGDTGLLGTVFFRGAAIPGTTNGQGQPLSYAKQLQVQFPVGPINTGNPGLYPLSVARTTPPLPAENNPSVTDLAVFPDYSMNPPTVINSIPAGTNPSAIDIDPVLGVVAVAETGSNAVQFFSIGTGTLTPLGGPVAVGKVPTGLSVNRTNHTVAVVNYQDQSVTVLPIPGAPVQAPGTPFTLDMSGVLQGQASPSPLPYAIGVDPDTNMGIVAYSSTSASTAANLGFLVNLNTGATPPFGCINDTMTKKNPGPCVHAQVTLNTGPYPQIAMAPHGHQAFVTPGGSGLLQGVDVTHGSSSAFIQSLTLAAGIVTVTTTKSNGLVPGNSGTVLITNVPATNSANNTNFNGVFSVTAISDTSFTYILNSLNSGTVTLMTNPDGSTAAQVFYGTPNLIFGGLSQTVQGISINPITNTAVLGDANATGRNGFQIYLINNLDQNVSNIGFSAGCTFYTVNCVPTAPELLGTADVAWQPYSNTIVSYNPGINQVSLSDPVTRRRYAFACQQTATLPPPANPPACLVNPQNPVDQQTFNTQTTLTGTGTATITVTNGTTGNLKLFGGVAVDPATNQAFVVMSGSGNIDIVNLGPTPANALKPAQVTEIQVPSPTPGPGAIGGIPNATVPQGTLTSSSNLAGVQIFGSGFDAATTVRLDGSPIPAGDIQFVSSRQLTVTIPASFLSFPHHYALDLVTGTGVESNATDFFVIQAVDLTPACSPVPTGGPMPSSVAIADQLVNGPFSPIAVVTNSNCNNISVVDINPTVTSGGHTIQNPNFGKILNSIAVGKTPQGVAVSQPFGLAVVANNGDGTASAVNLLTNASAAPAVSTGTNPTGVAINDSTGAAIITNTGSNTVTEINLASLFGTGAVTKLVPVSIGGFQQPTAVAIDPDGGTNNQGLAVVTTLQLVGGSAPQGALAPVDIGLATPALSTTIATGSVTAPTTGIVFDPTVATSSGNPGVFYASSSGGNVITSYNPNTGGGIGSVNVGINPTALAINPETGAILTTNVAANTISIVDTTSNPLKTVKTLGLPGSPQFGVAIDQFTNLAVIVDQVNNRLLIFPIPN